MARSKCYFTYWLTYLLWQGHCCMGIIQSAYVCAVCCCNTSDRRLSEWTVKSVACSQRLDRVFFRNPTCVTVYVNPLILDKVCLIYDCSQVMDDVVTSPRLRESPSSITMSGVESSCSALATAVVGVLVAWLCWGAFAECDDLSWTVEHSDKTVADHPNHCTAYHAVTLPVDVSMAKHGTSNQCIHIMECWDPPHCSTARYVYCMT